MILDSSAVIAVLTREPAAKTLVKKMLEASVLGVGTPTLTETSIVLSAKNDVDARGLVARFIQEFRVEVIAFSDLHWQAAAGAFLRYGKGRHPAGLNYGDCMSYAVASLADQPLLFVGDDFPQTDLVPAW